MGKSSKRKNSNYKKERCFEKPKPAWDKYYIASTTTTSYYKEEKKKKERKDILGFCIALAILFAVMILPFIHIFHSWSNPTCYEPQTCSTCGKTKGEPLTHNWQAATCTNPKSCSRCFETEGDPLGHRSVGATETRPGKCSVCGERTPSLRPKNGRIFLGRESMSGEVLTVTTSNSAACYVKLKNANGKDVLAFFVEKNSTASVHVPSGYYYVYFAHGTDWYGPTYIFGPDTEYSKDEELVDFINNSWTYEFRRSQFGNFTDKPVSASEFN